MVYLYALGVIILGIIIGNPGRVALQNSKLGFPPLTTQLVAAWRINLIVPIWQVTKHTVKVSGPLVKICF